jgi:hypothetical protein
MFGPFCPYASNVKTSAAPAFRRNFGPAPDVRSFGTVPLAVPAAADRELFSTSRLLLLTAPSLAENGAIVGPIPSLVSNRSTKCPAFLVFREFVMSGMEHKVNKSLFGWL